MSWVWLALIAFLSGSLPFSVWVSKAITGQDARQFGDGNPGAANAFRTGNKLAGLLVLLLDISKAAAPVGYAYHNLNIRSFPVVLIALAPLLGHVFSPFLGFRGGKGIATAFGVWIGLTLWKVSLPGLLAVVLGLVLFSPVGWAVLFALAVILIALLLWSLDPVFLWVLAGEVAVLAWTHRLDLRRGIHLRPWLKRHTTRGQGRASHG